MPRSHVLLALLPLTLACSEGAHLRTEDRRLARADSTRAFDPAAWRTADARMRGQIARRYELEFGVNHSGSPGRIIAARLSPVPSREPGRAPTPPERP